VTTRTRAPRLAPEARREQLLEVAADVFRGRTLDDVSLDEVAEAAGVARGLINHHFGTKRGLYVEVMRHAMRAPELPVPEHAEGETARSRFQQAVGEWLDALERAPELWIQAVDTSGAGDPEITEIVAETRDQASRRIVQVMGLGALEQLQPERRAMVEIYRAMVEAAVRQWLESGRLSREQAQNFIVETGVRAADGLLDELSMAIGS
jgi:AcrR family transcriptional regulator